MATFDQHIKKAKENLAFLERLNETMPDQHDWQVTACYYVAVHLSNAHIERISGKSYKTHAEVKKAINPFIEGSCSVDNNTYLAYEKLTGLSRRSRYMCHDRPDKTNTDQSYSTHSIHLAKAIRHLNTFIGSFNKKHDIDFEKIKIKCIDLNHQDNLKYFERVA